MSVVIKQFTVSVPPRRHSLRSRTGARTAGSPSAVALTDPHIRNDAVLEAFEGEEDGGDALECEGEPRPLPVLDQVPPLQREEHQPGWVEGDVEPGL